MSFHQVSVTDTKANVQEQTWEMKKGKTFQNLFNECGNLAVVTGAVKSGKSDKASGR